MSKIVKAVRVFKKSRVSLVKTLYLNFRVLPLKQATKLPLLVSRYVKIRNCRKNSIKLYGDIRPFMVTLGVAGSSDLKEYNLNTSYLDIRNGSLKSAGMLVSHLIFQF